MQLPEPTARYLGLAKIPRQEFLQQSYRSEALKNPQSPRELIQWHSDKLKEYCERFLLLSSELAKSKPDSCLLLLNSDARVCIQIAVEELEAVLVNSKCGPKGMSPLVDQFKSVLRDEHLNQVKDDKLLTLFQCIYAAAILSGQCFASIESDGGLKQPIPLSKVGLTILGSRLSEIVNSENNLESRFTDVLSCLQSVTPGTS